MDMKGLSNHNKIRWRKEPWKYTRSNASRPSTPKLQPSRKTPCITNNLKKARIYKASLIQVFALNHATDQLLAVLLTILLPNLIQR